MLVKAQSWESVVKSCEARCEADQGFKPMVDLVRRLAASPRAGDLYPLTATNTIILSRTPQFDMRREVLVVGYDPMREYFDLEFRWQPPGPSDGLKNGNWTGYCPPRKVYLVIAQFFRLQGWFEEFPG